MATVSVSAQLAEVPRRPRFAWVWAAVWLVYLYDPALQAWHSPMPQRALALAAIVLFSAAYITGFAVVPRPIGRPPRPRLLARVALVGLEAALAVVIAVVLGEPNLAAFIYVAALAMFLLPPRWGWSVLVVLLAGTLLAQVLVPGWYIDGSTHFQILVAGIAMWAVTQIIARNRALAVAHEKIARLAAEQERNRLARDLHDILGHSLTVVAVKAELAGRLVHVDPDRAATEILDVERLARGALSEVRATVAGSREVSLGTELANARTALTAAGIDADLPAAVDDVPDQRRELFGWVVREGVTNVVRHSGASRCRIQITPSTVTVSDDGPAAVTAGAGGRGLAGLRERAEAVGGTLRVGRSPEGGFALTVAV